MNNPVKIRYKKKSNKFAGTVMFLLIFLLSVSTIITIQIRSEKREKQIGEASASTISKDIVHIEEETVENSTDKKTTLESLRDVEDKPIDIESDTNKQSETIQVYLMPMKGNVIKEYSTDNLLYSKTMEDWRQHLGTDIACGYESDISSMAEGIVSDIYSDSEYGTTVVIEHPGDIVTRYSNINVSGNIAVGTSVKAGDIIGSVISNPVSENEDELHIHIEAAKGSVRINPMSLIK